MAELAAAVSAVEAAGLATASSGRRSRLLPTLPYPGIRPFRKDEWPIFCGRQRIVDELLDIMVKEQFVPVLGTSGCGKSSIVKAGLIATLEREYGALGAAWRTVEMRPGNTPMWCLSEALWTATHPDESTPPTPEQMAALRAVLGRGPNGIDRVLKEYGFPSDLNLLLLVDQFEELFRFGVLGGEAETRTFLDQLLDVYEAQPHGIHIVLTMRTDFIADCARWPRLAVALNQTIYLLRWMTDDELREAIAAPALLYRGKVEPDLVERIIRDSGGKQDQLPVIEHALKWMWDRVGKQSGAVLTLADYLSSEVGGIDGALSQHADQIYEDLARSNVEPNSLPRDLRAIAKRLFQALTAVDGSGRAIRRPCTFGDLRATIDCQPAQLMHVINAFRKSGCSFLMPDENAEITDTVTIDVSHEALIRQWSKMKKTESAKGWLEEERQDVETWRSLANEAGTFHDDNSYLLSSRQTQRFETWRKERQPSLAWAARYSSGGSSTFENALELLQKSVERQQLWRFFRIVTPVVAVAALIGAGVWYYLDLEAEAANLEQQHAKLAAAYVKLEVANTELAAANTELAAARGERAEFLTKLAFSAADEWRGTNALVSAREAVRLDASPMAEGAAYRALTRHFLIGKYETLSAWDWSADGKTVAQTDGDTVNLIDTRTGARTRSFEITKGSVFNLDLRPDAQQLAMSNTDLQRIEIWDVKSGAQIAELPDWDSSPNLVFSPDGRWFGMSDYANAGVVDTQTWKHLTKWRESVQPGKMVFSPDSQYLAIVSDNDQIMVVAMKAPGTPVYKADLGGSGGVPAFAGPEKLLALPVTDGSGRGKVRLIDYGNGKTRDLDLGQDVYPRAVAFDRTGSMLAVTAEDGALLVLDTRGKEASIMTIPLNQEDWKHLTNTKRQGAPSSLHVWPDGSAFLVNTSEGPATIVDSRTGDVRGILYGSGDNYQTTIADDGSQVVMDNNPTIGLWRSTPVISPQRFEVISKDKTRLSFDPPSEPRTEQVVGVAYDGGSVSGFLTRSTTAIVIRHLDDRQPDEIARTGGGGDATLEEPGTLFFPSSNGLWIGAIDEDGNVSRIAIADHGIAKLGTLGPLPSYAQIVMDIDADGRATVVRSGQVELFSADGKKTSSAFDIGGRLLAVDADRHRVLMTSDDDSSNLLLADLSGPTQPIGLPLPELSSYPLAGALSSDGRFAAAVHDDRTVSVWDIKRRVLVASMGEPYQYLGLPVFPPQGNAIDVMAWDGIIYRWRLFANRRDLEIEIDAAIPGGLSDEEKQQMLQMNQPDQP